MWIITYRRWFYGISVALLALTFTALSVWGLKLGIDFKGGSLIEVTYQIPDTITALAPTVDEIRAVFEPFDLGDVSIRTTDTGHLIRTRTLSDSERSSVTAALSTFRYASIGRIDSVGPILSKEAAQKSYISIGLVLIAIVMFVAFAFRKVSKPVASWKYGVIAVVALFHDVLIPTGAFAFLGYVAGFEVDTLFVTALLVVLGFSVHDTIVVFDRVRENLRLDAQSGGKTPFASIVGASVSQTLIRSINTSLSTLLSVIALYFFGPESTKSFSLVLMMGIFVGTYSSVFIASPLLVTVYEWGKRQPLKQ